MNEVAAILRGSSFLGNVCAVGNIRRETSAVLLNANLNSCGLDNMILSARLKCPLRSAIPKLGYASPGVYATSFAVGMCRIG